MPGSVGQYIGLDDIDGNKIFDIDLVEEFNYDDEEKQTMAIELGFDSGWHYEYLTCHDDFKLSIKSYQEFKIVGNKIDGVANA